FFSSRRRHTRFSRDWSSDVCSSDLMGAESVSELREIGRLLAYLKEPDPPKGLKDAWSKLPLVKKVISMAPKVVRDAPCQATVIEGDDVDLSRIPVQTCWPGDAGP